MKLLIATRSQHKLAEIREILADVPELELVGLSQAGVAYDPAEEELEPYDTFEENAISKARYFFEKTGIPTASDDSGLAVDALGGAPGVRSKRYAPGGLDGDERDQANNRHLLGQMEGVDDAERTARYVCVVAWVDGAGEPRTVRGEVEGRIGREPRGSGGFGYDPLFFVPDLGTTFASAPIAEKHARSHRGRAFRAFRDQLLSAPSPSDSPSSGVGK